MESNCEVGGWIRLPKTSSHNLDKYKEKLTYVSRYKDEGEEAKSVRSYIETEDSLYVPRRFLDYTEFLDRTKSIPIDTVFPKAPDPNHPKVKNPKEQKKFMDDLYEAITTRKDVLACAVTGSGKTVCALSLIPKLKQKTIVLVHTEDLRDQWISEIEDKLGIPKDQIGIIQGNKNTSKDKPITISLIQTLARREPSNDLFQDFGFVILDEAHRIATEFFNDVVAKFPAKYRLALTATPNKKDGSDVVLFLHFGKVSVMAETEVMPVRVFVHRRPCSIKKGPIRLATFILRKSKDRNLMLADHIIKAYKKGRNIIGVSGSIEQIQTIIEMVATEVPREDIGQLTATKLVGKKSVKVSKEDRDIAKTKRVILATDGLVREGLDIPRLDMGIDLEPFYNATQRVGRIRRYVEGKKLPYWITILDECEFYKYDPILEENVVDRHDFNMLFRARLNDYNSQGFEIISYDGK